MASPEAWKMMDREAVKAFVEGIGGNNWRWDLREFANVTGFQGEYAKAKFLEFRALADALGKFDLDTLVKLSTLQPVEAK